MESTFFIYFFPYFIICNLGPIVASTHTNGALGGGLALVRTNASIVYKVSATIWIRKKVRVKKMFNRRPKKDKGGGRDSELI